ncbi:polysaccharide deacetylase family protein [Alteribacter natronophilus]|uniref:polysaccharide deacetylase family protein n=1 Tax=Alteribacter natronophilus TaxID=2583810 RepID=UPI00110EEEED|nr:polysaccharide deacetylase family protein [Alteribacter natronophilus]TMW70439.1 polysaccharide deacetylase family protein [Alteribacter natronophilus]
MYKTCNNKRNLWQKGFLGLILAVTLLLGACMTPDDYGRGPADNDIGGMGSGAPDGPEAGTTAELEDGPESDHRVEMEPDSPSAFAADEDAVEEGTESIGFGELQRMFPETVVYRGPDNVKRVALTFDDGPDPRFTPDILDILEENDVNATFFVMGARAKGNPELLDRIDREGHVIGNHTYWHPNLDGETVGQLRWEIEETDNIINNIVGYRPALFRPPYGNFGSAHTESLASYEESAVFWTVDTRDWDGPPADEIINTVTEETGNGSIILMHDGSHWTVDMSNTVEALGPVIESLKDDGYEFVTIPELLQIRAKK